MCRCLKSNVSTPSGMTDYITGRSYSQEEIQEYIQTQEIAKYLIEGCIELAKEKPEKPLKWLGEWLIKNNKRKPLVSIPTPGTKTVASNAAATKAE